MWIFLFTCSFQPGHDKTRVNLAAAASPKNSVGLLHATLNKTLWEWKSHWNHIADDFNREPFIEFSSNGCSKEWKSFTLYFRILWRMRQTTPWRNIMENFRIPLVWQSRETDYFCFLAFLYDPSLHLYNILAFHIQSVVFNILLFVKKYKIHNVLLNCFHRLTAQASSLLHDITCVTLLILIHDTICSTKCRIIFLIGYSVKNVSE